MYLEKVSANFLRNVKVDIKTLSCNRIHVHLQIEEKLTAKHATICMI